MYKRQALDKITVLRQWAQAAGADLRIEVDGGINAETGKLCREAGADVLVAGSYILSLIHICFRIATAAVWC